MEAPNSARKGEKMSYFKEFDSILASVKIDDYWHDDTSGYAGDLISKFDKQDWIELTVTWRQRDDSWQERCAYVLDYSYCESSYKILNGMLDSKNLGVVLTALDSMYDFPSEFEVDRQFLNSLKVRVEQSDKSAKYKKVVCSLIDALISK